MNTLEQWEKRLTPYFNHQLGFIGEISISASDLDDMSSEIKALIQRNGLGNATGILTRKFPLTLLTFMASFAGYNIEQNYWQAFADAIGVNKQYLYNQRWHKNFTSLAKKHGLKVFDFEDDPNPYVTSIRFQGGIPSHSLPDYFERMVLPAVERPALREAPVKQTLKYLLAHAYFVDSPVLDFLNNSGDLGVEFFSGSCKLARHALDNYGAILSTDEVDLPEYIVSGFAEWWERREDSKQHWSKPYLQVAPYSEDTAVILKLPQQEITLELSANRLFWHITSPNLNITQERPCLVRRSQQSMVIKADYLSIPAAVECIEVSLNAIQAETDEEKELRRWKLSFIPPAGKTPIVAFNEQGNQINSMRQLPAEALYLLTPVDSEMIFDGESRQIEELIPLVDAWKDWKIEYLDLSQAWSLMLARNSQPLGDVIPIQGVIAQPKLVGGHLFQFQDMDNLLYTTELPNLSVPLASGKDQKARLSPWNVHVHSLGETDPQIDANIRLRDFVDQIEIQDDRGIFPLKYLLGENAAGIYEIRAIGPHGLSGTFRIRVWPKIFVIGHSLELTELEQNPKPSVFYLRLQDGTGCEIQAGFEGVDLIQTASVWQVSVPPEFNRVQLNLTKVLTSGGMVRVPITIPLAKLRWGLAIEKEPVEWGQTLVHLSIDQIRQADSASIHLEMYGLNNLFYQIKVRLVDIGETETMLQEVNLIHTDFTKDWMRVTLGQFSDSIRAIHSLGRFVLVYTPVGTDTQEIHFPLLEVSRALEITDVELMPVSETSWKLTWREDHPLKNRRVMLRPAWQPWQESWEYKIPDQARGEFMIEKISLPPSRYHLYFYIMPRYEYPLTEPPQALEPVQIDLCTPQERIEVLSEDCLNHNERFKNQVEIANIQDSLGDEKGRDETLSKAALSITHLTNPSLLTGTIKWIGSKNIEKPIKSFFFNRMFYSTIVETMLRNYQLRSRAMVEYLAFSSEVKNIPTDSAKLLLERVNDPLAIANCLRHLAKKEDDELLVIIVRMMHEARLSKRDAMELLSNNPIWAMKKVAKLPPSPCADRLIAELLPKVAQDDRLSEWMMRALPYEDDEQLIMNYLDHLFKMNTPFRFESLMKVYLTGKLSKEDIMKFLSQAPKISLEVLQAAPEHEAYQLWIDWLIEKYPSAAGIVKPGSILLTSFGQATIQTIENCEGVCVDQIQFGEPDFYLEAVVGSDNERIHLLINYHDMTINIEGKSKIWKCGRCDFMHPSQDKVMKHSSSEHLSISLAPLTLPVSFEKQEIQVMIEKPE